MQELTRCPHKESITQCLDELVMSEYGKQMFGVHDMCASVGYVLEETDGPELERANNSLLLSSKDHGLDRV